MSLEAHVFDEQLTPATDADFLQVQQDGMLRAAAKERDYNHSTGRHAEIATYWYPFACNLKRLAYWPLEASRLS
jgi:hypothetical protein